MLPRPTAAELTGRHDSDIYFDHPYFQQRREDAAGAKRRCRLAFQRIGAVTPLSGMRGARHLDVGCDTGMFLMAAARLFGTIPVGVDVSRAAITRALDNGIEGHMGDLQDMASGLTFPLITVVDVIEHVSDPRAFMAEVARRLEPGGVCYVETPNLGSSVYAAGGAFCRVTRGRPAWVCDRLFPPEHVQYFSPQGLEAVSRSAGLELALVDQRALPGKDIAVSALLRAALVGLQCLDRVSGERLLMCVVFRKPVKP